MSEDIICQSYRYATHAVKIGDFFTVYDDIIVDKFAQQKQAARNGSFLCETIHIAENSSYDVPRGGLMDKTLGLGAMDKTLGLGAGRSGFRILGRGKYPMFRDTARGKFWFRPYVISLQLISGFNQIKM